MSGETELRLDFLREVGALLWPAPARFTSPGEPVPPGRVAGEFILVPDARRPRILVPRGAPRAAAAALRGYGETGSAVARIRTRLLSWLLRSGTAALVLRDRVQIIVPETAAAVNGTVPASSRTTESTGTSAASATSATSDTVEERLRSVLGDVLIALYVRPARRANRKPVLQVLTREGDLTGFVKVGIDPLTQALVRAERDALRTLADAGLRVVSPPGVLYHGTWRDLDLLVLSALPVWEKRRPLSADRLAAAMMEIASVGGLRPGPLVDGPYWRRLSDRVTALRHDPGASAGDAAALDAALREIGSRAADLELRFGAWHGDFSPWNMANLADRVLVWDWERFTTGVPLGFDAFHHHLQSRVVRPDADPRAEAAGCVTGAAGLLAPLDVDGPQARVTALLYLIELSVRYLEDRQAEAGALLGAPGDWIIPVLRDELARTEGHAPWH